MRAGAGPAPAAGDDAAGPVDEQPPSTPTRTRPRQESIALKLMDASDAARGRDVRRSRRHGRSKATPRSTGPAAAQEDAAGLRRIGRRQPALSNAAGTARTQRAGNSRSELSQPGPGACPGRAGTTSGESAHAPR